MMWVVVGVGSGGVVGDVGGIVGAVVMDVDGVGAGHVAVVGGMVTTTVA